VSQFPFAHDNRVHIVADDRFEVAYYARDGLKYKRVRDVERQTWEDTIEQEIDSDSFWMIVACIELAKFSNRR
jgi:hypothetical protein